MSPTKTTTEPLSRKEGLTAMVNINDAQVAGRVQETASWGGPGFNINVECLSRANPDSQDLAEFLISRYQGTFRIVLACLESTQTTLSCTWCIICSHTLNTR